MKLHAKVLPGVPDMPQTEEEADELARLSLKKMGAAQVYLTRVKTTKDEKGQDVHGRPYLAPAVMRLRLIPRYHESLLTAGVDSSWRLYFNPVFVMKSSIELLSAVVEHEIWHLLLDHHRIADKAGIPKWAATLWNIAADCEIHNDNILFEWLKKNGFDGLNHKSIGCSRKADLIAYYHELMERAIIYKTVQSGIPVDKKSYEVFINQTMSQEEYDSFDAITVIHKGTGVK
jgi:hypothetical protein